MVTVLVSQENQWELRLSRISEVIMNALGCYWYGCYIYLGVLNLLYIVMGGKNDIVCPVVTVQCWS